MTTRNRVVIIYGAVRSTFGTLQVGTRRSLVSVIGTSFLDANEEKLSFGELVANAIAGRSLVAA